VSATNCVGPVWLARVAPTQPSEAYASLGVLASGRRPVTGAMQRLDYSIISSGRTAGSRYSHPSSSPERAQPAAAADVTTVLDRCRVRPGELSPLNQYSGRPRSEVADCFRSKPSIATTVRLAARVEPPGSATI
jgi:hypothetical protein